MTSHDASTAALPGEIPPAPNTRERLGNVLACAHATAVVVLLVVYTTTGDRTPWGEYLTIWPSILWAVLSGLLALPFLGLRRRRFAILPPAAVLLFCLATLEWRGWFRRPQPVRTDGDLRVVTWNIGGGFPNNHALLDEIARWEPDLVFLQETPDDARSFQQEDLSGYWEGFEWVDVGDCGVLSRWPMKTLPTRLVGPWEAPLLAAVAMPGRGDVLIADVRLMLPSLELLPLSAEARNRLSRDNKARVAQYPALASLLRENRKSGEYAAVILAGDFNTDASARSLRALCPDLRDVWGSSGAGWGRTITRTFPVGRIDQVWTSPELEGRSAWVPNLEYSDHRPVVAELKWRAD